jgi:hypothetical protein
MENPYQKYLKGVQIPTKTSDNPYSKYLPEEDRNQFNLSTQGNPGKNLSDDDKIEPGETDDNPYAKYLPENIEQEKEDIDGDVDLWDKIAFATKLGFTDTVRGVSQISGGKLDFISDNLSIEQMKEDQKKLYEYMENPDGSTNYMVAAAYFGSALLDPAGWLIPVTKARTLYKAAKYGFVSSGIAGGLGYVDENSLLDTRGKQAAASAIGGTVISPVIAGVGKKLRGEKVFTRESLGIPGFDSPSIKVQADVEVQKVKLQNEAGKRFRDAEARKKIEIEEPELIKDLPENKTKMLQGPRLWFREYVVKPYEKKFGKPALNYLTNGEYGAEAGTATAGGLIGYVSADDDAPITTKFGRAVAGALMSAGGIKATRYIQLPTRTFAKGEAQTEEISETLYQWLGRQFIDGYGLPKEFKALKAEAQGYSNHIAMRFANLANKIKNNLTDDEQKILHNLLQGDTKLKAAPEALQNLSKESRKLINEIAQEYVDAGLITRKTFEDNKNKYLKRSYKGKLEDRPFGEELKLRGATLKVTKEEYNKIYKKQKAYTNTSEVLDKNTGLFVQKEGRGKLIKDHKGWELLYTSERELKKLKAGDEVEIRWQFTKPQRVGLSEIEDASYAIAETGRAFSSTLSQYRFYKNISKTEYVYNSLGRVPMQLRDKYKMIPDTVISKASGKKRFGALAGKYVPEEIYKNLVAANKYYQTEGKGFYKGYRKLNSLWKVSKTAWNPTVHVNNVMSNIMLHDLIDAEFKYLPKAWTALTTHGKKNKAGKIQRSELVEAATKYGVFDADFVSTELKNIQSGIKFPYKFDENLSEWNNAVNASASIYNDVLNKNVLSTLTEWYRFEDSVFRLSVFQDRLAKGWSTADAALDARKAFIDYNIDAPAINWMRNTVTPFLAYTYRIVPILAETAIVRPWKYAKYAALGYGLNAMGNVVGGGDEEAERAVMPERKSGRFINMGFLPYRNIKIPVTPDKEGNPYYMDFTRFVPGGDILDLGAGAFPGVPAPLQPSGGLAGEALFPLIGYDLFRQKKIEGQTGIPNEDWPIRFKTLKDKLVPNIPFLPGSYSSAKLERTRKGMDSLFRPEQSELLSLSQALGFKIEKADLDKLSAGKAFELKRKLNGFTEQINTYRKKLRDGLITQETAQKEIEKISIKMRELSEKYSVKFDKATYAKEKKPFEDIKGLFERKN